MTKTELETTQTTCDNEQVGALANQLARPGWTVSPFSWLAKVVEVVFISSKSKHTAMSMKQLLSTINGNDCFLAHIAFDDNTNLTVAPITDQHRPLGPCDVE